MFGDALPMVPPFILRAPGSIPIPRQEVMQRSPYAGMTWEGIDDCRLMIDDWGSQGGSLVCGFVGVVMGLW